jgi:hypothetical protein
MVYQDGLFNAQGAAYFGNQLMMSLSPYQELIMTVEDNDPLASKPAVPEGWKLVPVEPTDAMVDAACPVGEAVDHFDMKTALREAIAAYPTAPAQSCGAQPISDAMMDLVDRLGSEAKDVDPRAWAHLLVYAPSGEDAANGGSWERADIEWLLKLAERSAHDGDLSIARVRAALTAEKVAAEPVMWVILDRDGDLIARSMTEIKGLNWQPLYAAPQPAQTQVALTEGDGQ